MSTKKETDMDDKTRAKDLAKAHRAALGEWSNTLLGHKERSQARMRMLRLAVKRADHQVDTGWMYDMPDAMGEPGRWTHSAGSFWDRRTEWINDEKETGQ